MIGRQSIQRANCIIFINVLYMLFMDFNFYKTTTLEMLLLIKQ